MRGGAESPLSVRAYERFGGQRRLIVAAAIGFIGFNAGSTWLFAIAEHCGIVHFASQFAGSAERFAWLVQGCSVPATVQQILLPDFVVMFGYWLMFTAILIGGWWRLEAARLRRASWVLWLPTIAVAFDIIEYFFLSALLYKDSDGLFALRGDGGLLNWLQMAVSSAKWIAVAAMVGAGLIAAAVWISRRHAPFPPPPDTAAVAGTVSTLLTVCRSADRDDGRIDGSGSRVGVIGGVLLRNIINILLVALMIYLIAWPLGLFMTHCAIDSGQLGSAYCAPQPIPRDHFYAPSVVFAVAGSLWLIVGAVARGKAARTWPVGVLLLGLSLFLAAYLNWIPAWFRSMEDVSVAAAAAGVVIGAAALMALACGIRPLFGRPPLRGAHRLLVGSALLVGALTWGLAVLYVVAKSVPISVATPWGAVVMSPTSRLAVAVPAVILLLIYGLFKRRWAYGLRRGAASLRLGRTRRNVG